MPGGLGSLCPSLRRHGNRNNPGAAKGSFLLGEWSGTCRTGSQRKRRQEATPWLSDRSPYATAGQRAQRSRAGTRLTLPSSGRACSWPGAGDWPRSPLHVHTQHRDPCPPSHGAKLLPEEKGAQG